MKGKDRPDIIFLMLDTFRADVLKMHGGNLNLEAIEGISRKGTVYANAIAPGTYTVPSHMSLFLGKRVRQLKELNKDKMKHYDSMTDPFLTKSRYIREGEMTLAKHLSYLGYKTAMFSNNALVSRRTGLAEGFGHVDNVYFDKKIPKSKRYVKSVLKLAASDRWRGKIIGLACNVSRAIPKSEMDRLYINLRTKVNRHFAEEYGYYEMDQGASHTNSLVNRYAKSMGGENQFIFINYMEAHDGYPTNMITDDYVEQDKWFYLAGIVDKENIHVIKEAYKRRLEYLDTKIRELMKAMRANGLLDNAVLVIAGDHGQAFLEHDQMFHSMFPYNEVVHVPLIAGRFINGKQTNTRDTVSNPVSLSALNESLLRIGYGKEDMVDGNLRRDNFVFSDHVGITEVWDTPILKGIKNRVESARKIYREKMVRNTFATAIYHKNFKLIHYYGGRMKDELYDLKEDPMEEENVIRGNRGIALEMLGHNKTS
ncbi:MAG: sulfatase-like hydrolase/transferase [Candidatus Micrarchaeota archaeon]|nr:sulfatase-like hydrolase/transferase [Candidatus Micrarchaeota archaeon]MDE1824069.1 sulfatase-like hydrolase/transferase [Candidatus Micrarchaeota archaeon]MDE1849364.1 sulfatase-like hydrolase/transferase [Candidatus Micrarchaeota archaeon]